VKFKLEPLPWVAIQTFHLEINYHQTLFEQHLYNSLVAQVSLAYLSKEPNHTTTQEIGIVSHFWILKGTQNDYTSISINSKPYYLNEI
jgi:hypothetical protein